MSRSGGGIPCQRIQGMLSEYIDGKLRKADKGVVEAHIEVCDACSRELEALRMTVQLLHGVPDVPVPRSFKVVVPVRERAFGAASLRWLRPATAIAAIALVLLLVGDFVHVFDNKSGVDGGGEATSTYIESVAPAVAAEQQIMVKVPGVMGQMSLATARSVGYTEYDVLASTPVPQPVYQQISSVTGDEDLSRTGITAQEEAGVGWPLRQIEIALGAVIFMSVVLMILLRRRRGRVVAQG
ncbi:MAG: hypothetical protein FJ004_11290 [Chloroflexi bacterium]|nr:hypothetical protein [Chloroflexota bacterium]